MNDTQDTEVTLSTGKMLGFFFGMVIICGIFFSLGYALGKNSAPGASATIMDSAELSTVTASGGHKPSPGKPIETPPCPEGEAACGSPATEVKSSATAPPEMTASGTGLMVQVAAVSKQEDAEAMAAALRKKQYPVLVVPNQTSNLYHVQVGPFADQKDAEAMRARLANDGYNAILKR
jgi:cell division septation protein DedD